MTRAQALSHDAPEAQRLDDLLQLGMVAPLCLAAPDVRSALSHACSLSPLWCASRLLLDADRVRVEASALEEAVELALLLCRLLATAAGRRITPTAIHAPVEARSALRGVFDCAIYDDVQVMLQFASEDMEARNHAADAPLWRVLLAHAEQRLASVRGDEGMTARARSSLRAQAEQGDLRVERLARELGLGVRTLHRRLRAEGTSYRKLLAELQLERCRHQLASVSRSAKEVAFALGFADPASFHRAFKRWTGRTVTQYRAEQP